MAKILVVDDEKIIVKGIRFSLLQDQMEVDCAYDGEQAVEMARNTEYDVVLLDVMLPAKGDDMDKILGLEYGADDYVTKPFNILEVKARIKAIMRRSSNTMIHPPQPPVNSTDIVTGDLRLDVQGRRLFILGSEINVTSREFDLLKILVLNPNKVYSREELLNLVWGYEYPGDVRTVDVHIRRLREKIERNPSEPKYVFTKWGVGYYYKA